MTQKNTRAATVLTFAVLLISAAAYFAPPTEARVLPQEPDGKQLYLKNCKRCHGVLGTPTKDAVREDDKIPTLNDPVFYTKNTDKELFKAIKEGKGRNMKPFADKLTDKEIEAVIKYIHTLVREK